MCPAQENGNPGKEKAELYALLKGLFSNFKYLSAIILTARWANFVR